MLKEFFENLESTSNLFSNLLLPCPTFHITILNMIKNTIIKLLSIFFPFHEYNDRQSVLLQSSWIEKIMTTPQLKDYLWVHNK